MSMSRYIASGFVLLLAWGCTQSVPTPMAQSSPKPQAQIDGPFKFVATLDQQPQWAVRYDNEFWRTKNSDFKQSAIARVKSAFEPDLKTNAATVKGQVYTAKLTQKGLNLTLRTDRPEDRRSRHKYIETPLSSATMYCGQQAKSNKGNWSIAGNTAQRKMTMATEHIHTMPKHVEMSWIFQQQPCDDLTVNVHVGKDLSYQVIIAQHT